MHDFRDTLESEAAAAEGLHDALISGADFVSTIAEMSMSEQRDRLTTSIEQLEEARRVTRAHLFDALTRHGVSVGDVARMWGISRQLTSRIIRDLALSTTTTAAASGAASD